jgi:hypothetical protein
VSERLGDLTSRERQLVDAAASGDVLVCSQLFQPIEELSATDNPEHTIRAELLRELLLERCDKSLDPRGVRLGGARITGMLDLSHVEAAVGMELWGCSFDHPVLLVGAHLPWLTLTGSCVPALDGDRLQVDGDFFLDGGFRATGGGELGAVRLLGAHITGALSLSGAELMNEAGPALQGERLQVDGGLFLRGLRATGHSQLGTVRLIAARITGQLLLSGAELMNETGPALHGDRLQVNGGLFLDKGFRATGHGERGAVRLLDAHITGPLLLRGAKLTNEAGPALTGDQLQVNGGLFLDEGFRATGHGERGAVRLLYAHITSQLVLRGAELANEAGPVLNLANAETKTISLPPEVICPQGAAGRSTCDVTARRVALSGLVYTSLKDIHWSQWLHLIICHTDGYQPQPYQQLAAARRAAGNDADARKILIAQQQDLRERGDLGGWLTRTVHCLWGKLGGYGYRTGRIAFTLLIVLLAAAGLGVMAGHIHTSPGRYVAMHTAQADNPHGPCSLTEQIGVGIDRGLPLGTIGIRGRCDFDTTSRRGQAVTWATWVLQFLVWALATLFVAGYVSLIRKAT